LVGATAFAYFTLPSTEMFVGKARIIVLFASVAIGIATTLPSYLSLIIAQKTTNQAEELHSNLKQHNEELHTSLKQSLGNAEKSRVRAEELYATLEGRLKPLLLDGLEDMLKRIASRISERLSDQLNGDRLSFFVFMKRNNVNWVIVASTTEKSAIVRWMSLDDDEGIVGFTAKKKIKILANGPVNVQMFDYRDKRPLDQQNSLKPDNLAKCDRNVEWIYA